MVCFHLYFLVKALKKSIWMLVNPMDTLLQPTTLQWSSLTNVLHNLVNFLPNVPVSQQEGLRKLLDDNYFLILMHQHWT